jgi:site-specific DNA-methyltransferase (adenine-specific)
MRWNGGGKCARWHATSDSRQPGGLIVDGQKPLAFFRQLVADFTDPGDLICDPYAGGGTMAVVCQELGRDCLTYEDNADTYNKAQQRIKEAGKQQPLPLSRAKATQLQLGG